MTTEKWLVPWRSDPAARARIVCFPYVGAGASVFCEWSSDIPQGIDLYAVRLPGRERRYREPLADALDDVVPAVADAICASPLPCVLLGICSGSILSFETARYLDLLGRSPVHVVVASGAAPDTVPSDDKLSERPRDELFGWLASLGAVSPDMLRNTQLINIAEPMVRADLRMVESYCASPEVQIASPLTAVYGRLDADLTADAVEAWRCRTSGRFQFKAVDADHFLRGQGRKDVIRSLMSYLAND